MNEQLIVTLKVDELKSLIDESVSNALTKLPQKPEAEDLLKRDEVAKLFKISLVTLNQWMRDGRITFHKINSRIFFKRSEVMEALKGSIKKYGRRNENI
jgi:excisionase family DNA binding protein